MKLLKKSVAYVLAFITVFSSFTVLPSDFWGLADVSAVELTTKESNAGEKVDEAQYIEGDLVYSLINENEVKVVGCNGTKESIVIPDVTTGSEHSVLANKKVTAIGDKAFNEKTLETVTFGKNIVSIGNYAFYQNSVLETVDLSVCKNLKTIGKYAFYKNKKLKYLTLPNSLEIIDEYAFSYCNIYELETGANIKEIGKRAFKGNQDLGIVNITGGNNAVIGDYAFYDCSYMEILNIGNGVEVIGRCAFYDVSWLQDITIGDTVKTIKIRALPVNAVSKITIGTGLTTIEKEGIYCDDYYYRYNCDNLRNVEADIKIYSKKLKNCTHTSFPKYINSENANNIRVYCYENSETHKSLDRRNSGDVIKFLQTDGYITKIKVDNTYIGGFNREKKEYIVRTEKIKSIVPEFSAPDVRYTISKSGNVYTIDIFDDNGKIVDTYKLTLRNSEFYKYLAPTDIKVNGVSVHNFNLKKSSYIGYAEDLTNVKIQPVFSQENVKYTLTKNNDTYQLEVFDEYDYRVYRYTINVKEKLPAETDERYYIIGDVDLMLSNVSFYRVGGSIALPAGTYKIKIAKGDKQFGYNKTITDRSGGVKLDEKYSSYITLNATGGTYTFQFSKETKVLMISCAKILPNEYLVGDIDAILKPMNNRTLSVGTQILPKGTYKFKVSIGGKICGYNKVVDDTTVGGLTVNSKYSADITLNASGGVYTFLLNTSTNRLIIRHNSTDNECTTDIHISGDINLVLNDKNESGEERVKATGTIFIPNGCYTFRVYYYGVVYTADTVINNKGKFTLKSRYSTPVILNSKGGTYTFEFNKNTGVLEILKK